MVARHDPLPPHRRAARPGRGSGTGPAYPNRTLRYVQDITAAPWLVFTDLNPQPPVPSPKLGWMVGDLEIDPFDSNRMMYGTGATIYGAEDLHDLGHRRPDPHQGDGAGARGDRGARPRSARRRARRSSAALGDINGFRHDSLTTPPARMMSTARASPRDEPRLRGAVAAFIVRVGNVNSRTTRPSTAPASRSTAGRTGSRRAASRAASAAAARSRPRPNAQPRRLGRRRARRRTSRPTSAARGRRRTGIPAGAIVESDRVNPLKFYGLANGDVLRAARTAAPASPRARDRAARRRRQFKAVPGREGRRLAGGRDRDDERTASGTRRTAARRFRASRTCEEADNIGFGHGRAPGRRYPALYTSAQVGGVRGIYRSTDTRRDLDAHQRRPAPVRFDGRRHHRRPARLRPRVTCRTNGRGIIYGEPGAAHAGLLALGEPVDARRSLAARAAPARSRSRAPAASRAAWRSARPGLPTGVTASFSPTSTTGNTTTLTLAASATATLGARDRDRHRHRRRPHAHDADRADRDSAAADFSLSATPASLTVARGASGASTITITRTGGFTGSVAFTASGLPTGVTAAFNPTSTTGEYDDAHADRVGHRDTGPGHRDRHGDRRRPHPHDARSR